MLTKKKLAGKVLGTSPYNIRISPEGLEDVKKAITRSDIRGLAAVGKIMIAPIQQQSRGRARLIRNQKRKGRQRNRGSKRGSKYSIVSRKEKWVKTIRVQREFLRLLRDKQLLSIQDYRQLYLKCKGGYFRNKRHIKLYLTEHHLIQKTSSTPSTPSGSTGEI